MFCCVYHFVLGHLGFMKDVLRVHCPLLNMLRIKKHNFFNRVNKRPGHIFEENVDGQTLNGNLGQEVYGHQF